MTAPTRSPVSDLALRAFAAGFEALRRDFGMTPWDANGCRVWLGKLIHEDGADPFTAVAFMAKAAQDPAHETPGSVRLSSAREPFRNQCREHPAASLRTDGTCGGCFADRAEAKPLPVRDGRDVSEWVQQAKAKIEAGRAQ